MCKRHLYHTGIKHLPVDHLASPANRYAAELSPRALAKSKNKKIIINTKKLSSSLDMIQAENTVRELL